MIVRLRAYFQPNQQSGLRLGRAAGIDVWCHWFLLVLVLAHLVFYVPWSQPGAGTRVAAYMLAIVGSLLIHEIGHAVVAVRLGGGTEKLVLAPVGGLVACEVPNAPGPRLWVAAAGLLTSALLLVVAIGVCLAAGWELLPVVADTAGEAAAEVGFAELLAQQLVLWNAFLVIVNLVPTVPMDAGRMLQAWLWRRLESLPQATIVTLQVSRFGAGLAFVFGVVLFLWSLITEKSLRDEHPLLISLSVGLLLVTVLYLIESKKLQQEIEPAEEEETGIFGYDFSQGYTSLERSHPGAPDDGYRPRTTGAVDQPTVETKHARRRAERRERETREARERVDLLLVKIHEGGIESLSREERRFLKRASKLFRD